MTRGGAHPDEYLGKPRIEHMLAEVIKTAGGIIDLYRLVAVPPAQSTSSRH